MGKFIDLDTGLPTLWGRIKEYVGKGTAGGVAELDANGHVISSQLPSFVDDVVEYESQAQFPAIGETGKIYVSTSTNVTYRWSGSRYVAIGTDLTLGETSSTAYRGDRGAAAYTHGVTNKGFAFQNGFYKITTNAEGHVIEATPVTKNDITALGIIVPTKVSDLTNDSGYITFEDLPSGSSSLIVDDVTSVRYKLGVNTGRLYIEPVGSSNTSTVDSAVVGTSTAG